ncbi:conjugal transfer relaxosome DNA-binding protein TraM [Yersinia aleksiciae]|uniref:conjugal transfer relaxosome DNA-binding protein TraM n=1 Tax=Yersinia aleksiciae TaxID=263819 RepID=UPI0005DD5716|nr:conjugal transfer relaxosome DNA-binding protein TraM [Yersinia aleksiciae]CNI65565.1 conjugal transfer protein TraM [Yersinia frederiksenii]
MAKVQAYVSDEVADKIMAIVEKRKSEGAKESDISYSSVATMLLELGLRVYEAQMERKADPFNQMEFNKTVLENILKSQFTLVKVLGMVSLSPHLQGESKFNYSDMVNEILKLTAERLEKFFPVIDNESES